MTIDDKILDYWTDISEGRTPVPKRPESCAGLRTVITKLALGVLEAEINQQNEKPEPDSSVRLAATIEAAVLLGMVTGHGFARWELEHE